MTLTLIRHTSVACGPGICYGQSDVDVASGFELEAEIVRQQLTGHRFEAVYSSPLQRCTKLAEFCGYSRPIYDKRLMELNFGDWEGIAWNEITDPHIETWYRDWIHTPATNGESFADQLERVRQFLDSLPQHTNDNVLVFTHAGVIRALAILLGHVEVEHAFSNYNIKYGQLCRFTIE